jgi:molecular chaperone DnaJ
MDIQSDDLSVEQVQPIFGENLNYKLNLTLAEVVHGGEKEVIYKCQEVCPECQGISRIKSQENKKGFWGALFHSPTCKACKDTGRRQAKQTINVLIPPGVEKGMQIRVEGAGNAGLFGGVNGDLIIEIEVQEDSRFLQIGHDLFYYQYITEYQALNGVTLEIATIGGQANLVIPPESLAGQRFRLRKKGIPYFQEEKCGDQIVILTHDKNKLSEKRQFLDVLDSFAEAWLDTRKTELRSQKANDLICQVTYDDLR